MYVSSYEFDLPCVWQIKKVETFGKSRNVTTEKLFCNRSENPLPVIQSLLF